MPTMATFSNAPALGFGQRRGARPLSVQYLVLAGGAGGGRDSGGGGGAGGYRANVPGEFSGGRASAEAALVLAVGTPYALTVGAGGASATSFTTDGGDGGSSTFASITSIGGGGGASGGGSTSYYGRTGRNGGSGGGGSKEGGPNYGQGTTGQGTRGGGSHQLVRNYQIGTGGGGGGAGWSPPDMHTLPYEGTAGGEGLTSSITGTAVGRAGGGGGGIYGAGGRSRDWDDTWTQDPSLFGAGSGEGHPYGGTQSSMNATANFGGGGGGANWGSNNAGNGSSGVVIIKIPDNYTATFSAGVTRTGGTAVDGFRTWTVTAAGAADTVTFSRA